MRLSFLLRFALHVEYVVFDTLRRLQHPTKRVDFQKLRESFTRSVVRRMMTDVPWGVLLSGDAGIVLSGAWV